MMMTQLAYCLCQPVHLASSQAGLLQQNKAQYCTLAYALGEHTIYTSKHAALFGSILPLHVVEVVAHRA
jgi:hypothetical protein